MRFFAVTLFLLATPAALSGTPLRDGSQEPQEDSAEKNDGEVVEMKWWIPGRRLLSSEKQMPEELDVSFSAHSTQYHLRLHRNRLLLPGTLRHVLHHADGRTEDGPLPKACFFQGEVLGDVSGRASISACNGGFHGLVMAHGRSVTIEPLPGRRLTQGDIVVNGEPHRVSMITDEIFQDYVGDVAKFNSIPLQNSSGRLLGAERCLTQNRKYVEVVVVNDKSRYDGFGGQSGLTALATHTVNVMAAATVIYNAAPTNSATMPYPIQVVLVAVHTLVNGDPWDSTVTMVGSEVDCSSLLDHFNQWGTNQQAAGELTAADNRVLLSGRDFDGSTVGLAGVSTMCMASRTGNVNQCHHNGNTANCAAVVAHEMGHNFGMRHDGSGQNSACPQSGLIMEAVGGGAASTQFSSCSVANIQSFFTNSYADNGECLENVPTTVYGDPVCRNGFVESGEDCDCGQTDCSSLDSCCNGATCKFAQPTYQCSDATGPCCSSCMFRASSANHVCRAAKNTCDLAETCQGGTASCPRDVFVYPGRSCTHTHSGTTYSGLCNSGTCMSMEYICTVEITRDFDNSWDLTETCAAFNDPCGPLVCHKASFSETYECGQGFSTHGKQMPVPEGTPCWYPAHPKGTRLGMCASGQCRQSFALAVAPLCGNGGIDFGEQCDCGNGGDSCCECSICMLKSSSQCSSKDFCCDSSTCAFKAANTVCRAAVSECDLQEVCSGSSAICPSDVGKQWGTACTDNGVESNCYGKMCVMNLDRQCNEVTSGSLPVATRDRTSGMRSGSTFHECNAIGCCSSCSYDDNFLPPWSCSSCTKSQSSSTFTVNGVSNTIEKKGAVDGTVLSNTAQMCLSGAASTPASSCSSGQFLDVSVGRCLPCSTACTACTGPTAFHCTGGCKFGSADSRGACAISADQVTFACTPPSSCPTPAPTPAPPPTTSIPGMVSSAVSSYTLRSALLLSMLVLNYFYSWMF